MTDAAALILPTQIEPVIRALEPVLPSALVIGGWAHHLHHEHPLARPGTEETLQTLDLDVAFGAEASRVTHLNLMERFSNEGFEYEHTGSEFVESGHFRSRADHTFTVQLLTARRGSGTRRDGTPIRTLRVGGTPVEVLRGLDLLEADPWRARWQSAAGRRFELAVCHPTAFLLGKLLLTRTPSRPSRRRAKDLLYVVDTLALFAGKWEALLREAPSIPARVRPKLRADLQCAREESLRPASDELQLALRIAPESVGSRPQTASEFAEFCRSGLEPVFAAIDQAKGTRGHGTGG